MDGSPAADRMLAAALEYADRGWRVVPLWGVTDEAICECRLSEACKSPGKHPRLTAWQKAASTDAATIEAWWERWPSSNVGVVLGPASGIVDLECDDPAAEARLLAAAGGEWPIGPTFASGRGKHRLFKWDSRLPARGTIPLLGADLKLGADGRGAQSVFPPSLHWGGRRYAWLLAPDESDIPHLPERLLEAILGDSRGMRQSAAPQNGSHQADAAAVNAAAAGAGPRSARMDLYEQEHVAEGGRDNAIYAEACAMLREQLQLRGRTALDDPECLGIVRRRLSAINQTVCRPPLNDDDVKVKVESAIKFLRGQTQGMTVDEPSQDYLAAAGIRLVEDRWQAPDWRLYLVRSTPVMVRLGVPFAAVRMSLDMETFDSARRIHTEISQATGRDMASHAAVWQNVWHGEYRRGRVVRHGLRYELMARAEWVDPSIGEDRDHVIVASILQERFFAGAVEIETPELIGVRRCVLWRGAYWLRRDDLAESLRYTEIAISRKQLSAVLDDLGIVCMVQWCGGTTRRVLRADQAAIDRIAAERVMSAERISEPLL